MSVGYPSFFTFSGITAVIVVKGLAFYGEPNAGTIVQLFKTMSTPSLSSSAGKRDSAGKTNRPASVLKGLLKIQRTDLVGELAKAIANEVNNTMMAVTGHVEMELKKAGPKDRSGLQRVLAQATLATMMIQKLLDFGRDYTVAPQPVKLDVIIAEVAPLLEKLLGEQGELELALGAESTSALIDKTDLEQTLFALIVIARNVTLHGQKVQISTSVTDCDGPEGGKTPDRAGTCVALEIDVKWRAEHPSAPVPDRSWIKDLKSFGADLRRTLKQCGGRVKLEMGQAQMRLTLYFPVISADTSNRQSPAVQRGRSALQTVLVVEDDDAVRIPAAEFLMMEGYKVLQARTGNEALSVVQHSRSILDVMVTDILMPNMNGCELADALHSQYPNLKVLYMSGDPDKTTTSAASAVPGSMVLRKPFRLQVLKDRINELLSN